MYVCARTASEQGGIVLAPQILEDTAGITPQDSRGAAVAFAVNWELYKSGTLAFQDKTQRSPFKWIAQETPYTPIHCVPSLLEDMKSNGLHVPLSCPIRCGRGGRELTSSAWFPHSLPVG